jgi:hypothetical protein
MRVFIAPAGEFIDATNALQTAWPRACAISERLWSAEDVTDLNDAAVRIQEMQCRLIRYPSLSLSLMKLYSAFLCFLHF